MHYNPSLTHAREPTTYPPLSPPPSHLLAIYHLLSPPHPLYLLSLPHFPTSFPPLHPLYSFPYLTSLTSFPFPYRCSSTSSSRKPTYPATWRTTTTPSSASGTPPRSVSRIDRFNSGNRSSQLCCTPRYPINTSYLINTSYRHTIPPSYPINPLSQPSHSTRSLNPLARSLDTARCPLKPPILSCKSGSCER